jgi:rod shape-determining protein MreB
VLGLPVGATALERRALLEAGGNEAIALDEPIAAGIGRGIDPLERLRAPRRRHRGDTAEVTACGYGGIPGTPLVPRRRRRDDARVTRHLRERHHLLVGERTADP